MQHPNTLTLTLAVASFLYLIFRLRQFEAVPDPAPQPALAAQTAAFSGGMAGGSGGRAAERVVKRRGGAFIFEDFGGDVGYVYGQASTDLKGTVRKRPPIVEKASQNDQNEPNIKEPKKEPQQTRKKKRNQHAMTNIKLSRIMQAAHTQKQKDVGFKQFQSSSQERSLKKVDFGEEIIERVPDSGNESFQLKEGLETLQGVIQDRHNMSDISLEMRKEMGKLEHIPEIIEEEEQDQLSRKSSTVAKQQPHQQNQPVKPPQPGNKAFTLQLKTVQEQEQSDKETGHPILSVFNVAPKTLINEQKQQAKPGLFSSLANPTLPSKQPLSQTSLLSGNPFMQNPAKQSFLLKQGADRDKTEKEQAKPNPLFSGGLFTGFSTVAGAAATDKPVHGLFGDKPLLTALASGRPVPADNKPAAGLLDVKQQQKNANPIADKPGAGGLFGDKPGAGGLFGDKAMAGGLFGNKLGGGLFGDKSIANTLFSDKQVTGLTAEKPLADTLSDKPVTGLFSDTLANMKKVKPDAQPKSSLFGFSGNPFGQPTLIAGNGQPPAKPLDLFQAGLQESKGLFGKIGSQVEKGKAGGLSSSGFGFGGKV